MGCARHRGPLNWGAIGKIETVLEIRNWRWWPSEPKFKPYGLTDFCCCRRCIKNHPLRQACSNIQRRPNGWAHDNVGRRRPCGITVQNFRRKALKWRLGRLRGVVSTRWLPRWYGGDCKVVPTRRLCAILVQDSGFKARLWRWCGRNCGVVCMRRLRRSCRSCGVVRARRSCR